MRKFTERKHWKHENINEEIIGITTRSSTRSTTTSSIRRLTTRGKGGESVVRTSLTLLSLFLFLSFTKTKVTLVNSSNFTPRDKQKLTTIVTEVEKIINSTEFSNLVLNHSFNNSNKFSNNENKNNAQILAHILSGSEQLSPKVDNEWQLHLNLKWIFSPSVLAYTASNEKVIHINSRYFRKSAESSIAGTICHEYTHKLGYSHDKKDTPVRFYSVPYGVGNICSLLYTKNDTVNFDLKLPVNTLIRPECDFWCRIKGLFNVNN